ncbi:DUF1338 family protein [Litorivicinus lipolyticus]|uniref:2-oxoadipate dioxygenase/decarboxylase n=1 Tax=Litorivicinus lipolyticus TaxID=418701 RepID=A0A5Q2QDC2_9GAMM|nr:DUF1338 domain-containing protein [Litorivicinus lipolyticus]QGG81144.1 DUF1338 family protein [Litorivicinus lipolyticus]
MTCDQFFQSLWAQFVPVTPQAEHIHALLSARGDHIHNDHVAFRTFANSPVDMAHLVPMLKRLGYRHHEDYDFSSKHLSASSFLHAEDPGAPKIFLSELHDDRLSAQNHARVRALVAQIPSDFVAGPEAFFGALPWSPPTFTDYQALADESEYAGWLAAWGLRANHFTVDVNRLSSLSSIQAVNAFLIDQGFSLNLSGGAIKGTPADLLEQSSTIADSATVSFADGAHTVPSCFYEFALRHADASGNLYPGFVAANANKIFESTDRRNLK